MGRSHPPSVLRVAERTLREECGVRAGDGILLAVSGGGDSMALLHVLARLGPKMGLKTVAHGIDHGLRAEASRELDLAQELAERLGIEFGRTCLHLRTSSNLQARAREARYAALREAARSSGLGFVATAHHADDRAETVLIRLLRGAGPRGLAVLPPRAGDLLRPLIRVHRHDLRRHLIRHGILFAEDPSNQDRRFLRSRVRHDLLPLLTQLSPTIVEHLCCLSDQIGSIANADSLPEPSPLGRQQRVALERALRTKSWGFELRVAGGGKLCLVPPCFPRRV